VRLNCSLLQPASATAQAPRATAAVRGLINASFTPLS
jgi:hypothetical protein